MTATEQNFRPLIYLKIDPNQKKLEDAETRFILHAAVYLPSNYTVVSSGYTEEGENREYSIYVEVKSADLDASLPQPQVNFENIENQYSSELNWRVSEFVSEHATTGRLNAQVSDVTSGEPVTKGKSTIVLADADDTDIKLGV